MTEPRLHRSRVDAIIKTASPASSTASASGGGAAATLTPDAREVVAVYAEEFIKELVGRAHLVAARMHQSGRIKPRHVQAARKDLGAADPDAFRAHQAHVSVLRAMLAEANRRLEALGGAQVTAQSVEGVAL